MLTLNRIRPLATAAVVLLSAGACSAQTLAEPGAAWSRWQARLSLETSTEPGLGRPATSVWASAPASRIHSASLYGDYYFSLPSLAAPSVLGGFRATSGVLIGGATRGLGVAAVPASANDRFALGRLFATTLPGTVDVPDVASTLPYVGLGYTRLSVSGGWGFSADVGLVPQNPAGAWRLGSALLSPQSLDDAVRNLRLTPLAHFDIRYSF